MKHLSQDEIIDRIARNWYMSKDGSLYSIGQQFRIVSDGDLVTFYRQERGEYNIEYQSFGVEHGVREAVAYAEDFLHHLGE